MKNATLGFLEEYKGKRDLYVNFCERVKTIIKDALDLQDIDYVSVDCRAKTVEGLKGKMESGISFKKLEDVKDLVGIRIVTLSQDNVFQIEKILEKYFTVHEIDVEGDLAIDRIGYRSRHLVISLPQERIVLPEYERFKDLRAELQIRTVLEHAWAQIGHDQVYKASSVLPAEIERAFVLLSGLLEIADNEFSRVSGEIKQHKKNVADKTRKGNLDIPIDSVSLRQYFDKEFGKIASDKQFGPRDDMAEEIITELNLMEIKTLKQLDQSITKDFRKKYSKLDPEQRKNYAGIARLLMITANAKKYFDNAWKEKWAFGSRSAEEYAAFGINISDLKKEYPKL